MSHSLVPVDESLFPKCSPTAKNKYRRKKKKDPPSGNSVQDEGRKEILVDLLVNIDEEPIVDSQISPDNHVLKLNMEGSQQQQTPTSLKQLDLYGNSFQLPSCSSESSSSGASSISSSSKDNRRVILSDIDSKSPPLRDTKIEIAGGREIYSQSKTRSSRQKRSSSSKYHQKRLPETESSSYSHSGHRHPVSRGHQVLRETVFSSEIHSIEYHRPLIPVDNPVALEEEEEECSPQPSGDVNVTYDLIEGIFSPPSGLVVRRAEDEPPHTQDLLSHTPTGEADYVDTLYLGEEAADADKKQSVMIGGVKIAEYEGSPRRLRPRHPSSPPSKTTKASTIRRKVGSSASSSTTSSTSSLSGLRNKLPGFPQRILPPQEEPLPSEEPPVHPQEDEELLKFEEVPPPQIEKESMSPSTEYDTRYEFSETRKVLDEFFKDNSSHHHHRHHLQEEEEEEDFGELDYSLKRRPAAGNRLPGSIMEGGNVLNSNVGTLISPSNANEDLLCSSVVPPVVGLSPLDPASSVPSSIQNGYFRNNNSSSSNQGGPSPEILSNGGVEETHNRMIHLMEEQNGLESSRNFTLSPETTDCDSADLESEVSANEGSINSSAARIHLPVLEDGLSSGHASDLDDDVIYSSSGNVLLKKPSAAQGVVSSSTSNIQPHFSEGVMNKEHRRASSTYHHHHQILSHHNNTNNSLHHSSSLHLIQQQSNSLLHNSNSSSSSSKALLDASSSLSNSNNHNHLNNSVQQTDLLIPGNNGIVHSLGPFSQSNNGNCNEDKSSSLPLSENTHSVQLPPSTPIAHESVIGGSRKNELGFSLEPSSLAHRQHHIHHHSNKTDSSSTSTTSNPLAGLIPGSSIGGGSINNNNNSKLSVAAADESVAAALKDIKKAIQAARVLQSTRIPPPSLTSQSLEPKDCCPSEESPPLLSSGSQPSGIGDPWILRQNENPTPPLSNYDPSSPDNSSSHPSSTSSNNQDKLSESQQLAAAASIEPRSSLPNGGKELLLSSSSNTIPQESSTESSPLGGGVVKREKNGVVAGNGLTEEEEDPDDEDPDEGEEEEEETESEIGEERVPTPKNKEEDDLDTDQETDRLLGQQYNDDNGYYDTKNEATKKKTSKSKEALSDPKVLIEGVLFRARYLGSTQLVCEGQPTKATRMMQAEEAVSRIKAPDGENQPSTEVDLFISTEKIMVLNTDLKEIMMDHALRSISYIADIGDILVIMARRRIIPSEGSSEVIGSTPKMICHVFESEEAQFIAQSIGQAFQVAYMEFLKANGIEDHSFVKEMDYQEVLNSQEIFGDELAMFAKKELQKEVVVPKTKGEILGVVIVESGWGSMLPTIVLANLSPTGPAARCGHLNIGDQIIAINGISLVGLPLSTCQHYIKNTKNKTAVKLTAVSCAPVVEVKIKRPDTKYQLGFSVQNGVICSLLRGGIAERGGVRVGHRIIEINGQSVVAVPHERIVNLLATSVGEITMKTMPTSMFRLLTGQETPLYI